MNLKFILAALIVGAAAVAAFEPGTVMWTQLSQRQWYAIFRGTNGTSTFVEVPYRSNCANCWGYSAVDRNRHIYYYMLADGFRTEQWTLAGVGYSAPQAAISTMCSYNSTKPGLSYALNPYGLAAADDGTLYALLHSSSSSTGVFLAKLDPRTCAVEAVSTQAPMIDYIPIKGSFQTSYPEVYNGMLVYMASASNGVVAVSIDLATGKLITATPLPGPIDTTLPIISVGLDSATGIGYIQSQAFGQYGQFALFDYSGKVQAQFFNNTRIKSLATGMMVDSRSAQDGQPGPNFVDFVGSSMYFWGPKISGGSISLVMTSYVAGGKGNYPTTGALFGYRYDQTSRLGVN